MSVVVAVWESPTSYAMYADDHGVVNGLRIPSVKCHRAGDMMLGHAGSSADGALLAEYVKANPEPDDPEHMLRAAYHYARAGGQRATDIPGIDAHAMLVGPFGVIVFGSDGHANRPGPRWAIGCGEHCALGWLAGREGTPDTLARGAVAAACVLVDGCFGSPLGFTVGGT